MDMSVYREPGKEEKVAPVLAETLRVKADRTRQQVKDAAIEQEKRAVQFSLELGSAVIDKVCKDVLETSGVVANGGKYSTLVQVYSVYVWEGKIRNGYSVSQVRKEHRKNVVDRIRTQLKRYGFKNVRVSFKRHYFSIDWAVQIKCKVSW